MFPFDDEYVQNHRLPSRIHNKLFRNRGFVGHPVAVRLNLNGRIKKDEKFYHLQTIHDRNVTGHVLGYDIAVTLTNCWFHVDHEARAQIAWGNKHKHPMAGVLGTLSNKPHSFEGVEIRFNPHTSHLFSMVENNRGVLGADEVTIFNNRVYARGNIAKCYNSIQAPKYGIKTDVKF